LAEPAFGIFALSAGGGTLAISPMPGRSGRYDADLKTVCRWGPKLVLCMTEQPELNRSGACDLGRDLNASGIEWLHLPVPDFGVPVNFNWDVVVANALGVLQRKDRVLVHCMGGCGRSGMIALRLMIAAGEAPDAALARLRGIRACAVETDEQMGWARQG
jgi:hypothetical protein